MKAAKAWFIIASFGLLVSCIVMFIMEFDWSSITIFISNIAMFCLAIAVYTSTKHKEKGEKEQESSDSE